jgi:transposase-like protein
LRADWSFFGFAEWSLESKNTNMESHSKHGRRYDREFKENAVALVASGRAQREVARDLAIPLASLHCWVRLARSGQPLAQSCNLAAESPEQRELRRLQQENEYLRRQREILKKALGIFSAEMPHNATR